MRRTQEIGGRGGIRTHGRVAPTPDFESGAFNHSATLPSEAECLKYFGRRRKGIYLRKSGLIPQPITVRNSHRSCHVSSQEIHALFPELSRVKRPAIGTLSAIYHLESESMTSVKGVCYNDARVLGKVIAFFLLASLLTALTTGHYRSTKSNRSHRIEGGVASYYGQSYQGRTTASGEIYDVNELTAAHRTYPFGTIVRVTRLSNRQSVEVRINDRGPFGGGRIIDLSLAAARKLDMLQDGVAEVEVEILGAERADSAVHLNDGHLTQVSQDPSNHD